MLVLELSLLLLYYASTTIPPHLQLSSRNERTMPHGSFERLKTSENNFNRSGFSQVFSIQVSSNSKGFRFRSLPALHIQNLSNRCRHEYKLQFHEFIKFYFWRVFDIWHVCHSSKAGQPAKASSTKALVFNIN